MFEFLRSLRDRLIIDNGQVFCSIREKDTEIDICAACPRVRQIDHTGSMPFVRCRLQRLISPGVFWV